MQTNKSIKFSSKHDSWQDPNEFNLSCLESSKKNFDFNDKISKKKIKLRKIKSTNLFLDKKPRQSLLIPEPVEHFSKTKPVKKTFTSYFSTFRNISSIKPSKLKEKPYEKPVEIKKIDSFEDEQEIEFPQDLIKKLVSDNKSSSKKSIISKNTSIDSLSPIKKINSNQRVESFKIPSNPAPLIKINKCQSNQVGLIGVSPVKILNSMGLNDYEKKYKTNNPFYSNPKITDVKKVKLNYDKAVFSFLVWNKKDLTIGIHSFSNFSLQVSLRLSYFYNQAKDILKKIYNIQHQRLTQGKN